jgi:hypothetical protein
LALLLMQNSQKIRQPLQCPMNHIHWCVVRGASAPVLKAGAGDTGEAQQKPKKQQASESGSR